MLIVKSYCIEFLKNGNPNEVLSLKVKFININKELKENMVLVKWIAAPINPLDINIIEGKYAFYVQPPAIGGGEGVGIVKKVGLNVTNLKKGDHVILIRSMSTWTQYNIVSSKHLLKIDHRIDFISACTLRVNPPTAYLMLTQYLKLNDSEFVIQNAANSSVGRAVIQIAKVLRIKTINLIRNRSNLVESKNELYTLGADYVFTEEEYEKNGKNFIKNLNIKIRLGINGVGGKSALLIVSTLEIDGVMITYGGMSKKPSQIPTSALVFKNIKIFGIMVAKFMENDENKELINSIYDDLQKMILNKQLKPPTANLHTIDKFDFAIKLATTSNLQTQQKQILLLNCNHCYNQSKY